MRMHHGVGELSWATNVGQTGRQYAQNAERRAAAAAVTRGEGRWAMPTSSNQTVLTREVGGVEKHAYKIQGGRGRL